MDLDPISYGFGIGFTVPILAWIAGRVVGFFLRIIRQS